MIGSRDANTQVTIYAEGILRTNHTYNTDFKMRRASRERRIKCPFYRHGVVVYVDILIHRLSSAFVGTTILENRLCKNEQ